MTKKQWLSPTLLTHGSVEEITEQAKEFGSADGFTIDGDPIRDAE